MKAFFGGAGFPRQSNVQPYGCMKVAAPVRLGDIHRHAVDTGDSGDDQNMVSDADAASGLR